MTKHPKSESIRQVFEVLKPFCLRVLQASIRLDFEETRVAISVLDDKLSSCIGDASTQNEDELNDSFVLRTFCSFISSYSLTWERIVATRFSDSWMSLQDALDQLRILKKFSSIDLVFFENQLLQLEEAYPYRLFSSMGVIVDSFACSICGKDIDSNLCPHRIGELYSGQLAVGVAQNEVKIDHFSLVTHPDDKRCVISIDDNSDQFMVLRHLSNELKSKKYAISDFRRLVTTVVKKPNPDFVKQGRNEKCSCGSGLKFKKCCINKEYLTGDHAELVFEPFHIEQAIL